MRESLSSRINRALAEAEQLALGLEGGSMEKRPKRPKTFLFQPPRASTARTDKAFQKNRKSWGFSPSPPDYSKTWKDAPPKKKGGILHARVHGLPEPKGSTLDPEEVLDAVQSDSNTGFCMACGEPQDGVEPDAKRYKCDSCGAREVYGAEHCLMMIDAH